MLVNVLGLILGLGVVWANMFVHEAAHWMFTVQFGGFLSNWHTLPMPGWSYVIPAAEPWGMLSFYAGGLFASLFLILLIFLAVQLLRRAEGVFWWWFGFALAIGASLELYIGAVEGAFRTIYTPCGSFIVVAILTVVAGCLLYCLVVPPCRNSTTKR